MENIDIRIKYEALIKINQKDSLTYFFTREAFDAFMNEVIREASGTKKCFSLAVIDIDHFKKFNDKFGHLFGDDVLRYMGGVLRLALWDDGILFRYGGDEFVVVFPEKDPELAYELMRQCGYVVSKRPFFYQGKLTEITFSCGIASFPYDAKTKDELFKKADQALYFSKRYGRNSTIQISKVNFLRFRRIFLILISIIMTVIGILFIARNSFIRKNIQSLIYKIKSIRVVETDPGNLDTIILKSGNKIEGYIIGGFKDAIEVKVLLEKGEGTVYIDKSEVENIRHRLP